MQITINRQQFADAFSLVARVAPQRHNVEILRNVLLSVHPASDHASLIATDLEVQVTQSVSIDPPPASVMCLLPAVRMKSILSEDTSETLHISVGENEITIRGDRATYRLPVANVIEFPAAERMAKGEGAVIPARTLARMIRQVAYATDADSSRFALGGVKIETEIDAEGRSLVHAIGTDGRRIAHATGEAFSVSADCPNVIIPTRAAQLIESACERCDGTAGLEWSTNAIEARIGDFDTVIYARLLEGRYPNWRQTFPQRHEGTTKVSAGSLLAAIRQAAICTDHDSRGIDVNFGPTIRISSQTSGIGSGDVEIDCEHEGKDMVAKIDNRYAADVCKSVAADEVLTITYDKPDRPIMFAAGGLRCVVMPMSKERA